MNRTFAGIAFTHDVKAAQILQGSREKYARFEEAGEAPSGLSQREIEFIESRNSFYQATVSETGWPYVQHRGGPAGFLKVLDANTLAFADFRGNRQYVSVGNLSNNDRIALIMVDYPNRRRLKLLGHVRLIQADDGPTLIARLAVSGYSAQIERAFIIHVVAWDWNCSQHITPRYTKQEIEVMAAVK